MSGIGTPNIAARPAGKVIATAAAMSGVATKMPMTGNGLAIVSQPAADAAAANPIQRPATPATTSFAGRPIGMKVRTALTISIMSAAVAMVPRKSTMAGLPVVTLNTSITCVYIILERGTDLQFQPRLVI